MQAAREQVQWELAHPGKKPGALTIAKTIGMSTAPEWLASTRYSQVLEIIRFESKVKELQARPEIASTISELISLGLLEAQRRLILNPSEIPATVLYGDILHKWPKMLADMSASKGPVATGDVFQTIVYEINMIQDPGVRERLRTQLVGKLENAALALNAAQANTAEVTDAELVEHVGVDSGDDSVPELVRTNTALDGPDKESGILSGASDSQLWDDPALD